jgi:hypothetical protein
MSKKQNVALKVPIEPPTGYEYTGEMRHPKEGENFLSNDGDLAFTHLPGDDWPPRVILRKKLEFNLHFSDLTLDEAHRFRKAIGLLLGEGARVAYDQLGEQLRAVEGEK